MYAVVEFEKKQCDVIPLCWLRDNQTNCLWPRNITDEKALSVLVRNQTAPKSSWMKYMVMKVYALIDDYDEAVTSLQAILDESATSTSHDTGQSNNAVLLKRKVTYNQSSDSEPEATIKRKPPKRRNKRTEERHSDAWSSSEDEEPLKGFSSTPKSQHAIQLNSSQNLLKNKNKEILNDSIASQTLVSVPDVLCKPNISKGTKHKGNERHGITPSHSNGEEQPPKRFLSTPIVMNTSGDLLSVQNEEIVTSEAPAELDVTNAKIVFINENDGLPAAPVTNNNSGQLLEEILRHVIYIREIQDQNAIRLEQIERLHQTATVQELTRPQSVPILPVNTKKEFQELENFLTEDVNLLYMRRRLAAVGGYTVRNSVMNMLKFLISNKVAMNFNWSGRDKRPFKGTKISGVINEAVKLSYSGREPPDLNDSVIAQAIKDWLKLAKHRHRYNAEKS